MLAFLSNNKDTKIAFVYPLVVFRKGLMLMIRSYRYTITSSCNTATELMAELPLHPLPDVIFLPAKPSESTTAETIAWLKKDFPSIKIIVVGFSETRQEVEVITSLGAHGYISASAEPRDIKSAIKAVCKGETFVLLCSDEFRRPLTAAEIAQILARIERKKWFHY